LAHASFDPLALQPSGTNAAAASLLAGIVSRGHYGGDPWTTQQAN